MGRRAGQTLTQTLADHLKPTGKQRVIGDAACPGLRLWQGAKGEKRWQIKRPNGRLQILPFQGTTLQQARLIASQPEQALPAQTTTLTIIGPLIDAYVAHRGEVWAKSSRRPQMIRKFLEPIQGRPITTLTRDWINARLDQLLKTHKGHTVETYRKATSGFVLWLIDEGVLTRTPMKRLRKVPINPVIGALTDGDLRRLKARCWTFQRSTAVAAAVLLAVQGGLRKGEILQLTKQDINLTLRRVMVRAETTKSRKARMVWLPDEVLSFLEEHLPTLPDPHPFAPPDFDHMWRMLRASANLTVRPRFHDLRHTYATTLLRKGANIRAVQAAMGHSSLLMTQIYVHALDEDQQLLATLLND